MSARRYSSGFIRAGYFGGRYKLACVRVLFFVVVAFYIYISYFVSSRVSFNRNMSHLWLENVN